MNPFVNPNKRDVSLPPGCKDLMDVLKRPGEDQDSFRQFIHKILSVAESYEAKEVVIRPIPSIGETSFLYKLRDSCFGTIEFPAEAGPAVTAEIARMASLHNGPFPKEGVLQISFGSKVRSRWSVTMTSPNGDCILTRVSSAVTVKPKLAFGLVVWVIGMLSGLAGCILLAWAFVMFMNLNDRSGVVPAWRFVLFGAVGLATGLTLIRRTRLIARRG